MGKMTERLAELDVVAAEEGVTPNQGSRDTLGKFANVFGEPLAVFLLDNGNYRARWHSTDLSAALEFQPLGAVKAIFLRRAALASEGEGK